MRIIVCSDNHGNRLVLRKILAKHPDAEAFIHCGDNELSYEEMAPFKAVTGNNDYYYDYPESLLVELDGVRIWVMHSHTLPYNKRLEALAQKAREHNCSIACFGHSHVYRVEKIKGVLCINPGSLAHNRDGAKPCYAIVDIDGDDIQVTRAWVHDL